MKKKTVCFSVFWVIEERRYSKDKRDKMGLNFRVFSLPWNLGHIHKILYI